MSRLPTFPSELYVTVEQAGSENEFLQPLKTLGACADIDGDVRVGRYMLHEVIVIGTKVVIKKSSPR